VGVRREALCKKSGLLAGLGRGSNIRGRGEKGSKKGKQGVTSESRGEKKNWGPKGRKYRFLNVRGEERGEKKK